MTTLSRHLAGPPEHSLDLDGLAADWWLAYAAAERGLRYAAPLLGSTDAQRHGQVLAEQHREAARLLQGFARDLRRHSALIDWLGGPIPARAVLGLPDDIQACVFDLDGVLTTSADAHAAAWEDTFDSFLVEHVGGARHELIPFDRHHEYERLLAGRPRLQGVRAFLASRGIQLPEGEPGDPATAETVHGLARRKHDLLVQRLHAEGVRAFAGSRTYLEAARMFGVQRAVVSASASTEAILVQAGLAHLIAQRVDADTISGLDLRAKPAPDTLLVACTRLGVPVERAAAFETTPQGVRAAREAGFGAVVAVDRDGHTEGLYDGGADRVVNDLAELLTTSPHGRPRPIRGGAPA